MTSNYPRYECKKKEQLLNRDYSNTNIRIRTKRFSNSSASAFFGCCVQSKGKWADITGHPDFQVYFYSQLLILYNFVE